MTKSQCLDEQHHAHGTCVIFLIAWDFIQNIVMEDLDLVSVFEGDSLSFLSNLFLIPACSFFMFVVLFYFMVSD
jgi:hypothetical protein